MRPHTIIAFLVFTFSLCKSQADFKKILASIDGKDSAAYLQIDAWPDDKSISDNEQKLFFYLCKGERENQQDRVNSSVSFFYKALTYANKINKPELFYEVYKHLGKFYFKNGNYQDALTNINKAILNYRGEKKNKEFLALYIRVGVINLDLKNYDQVFSTYETVNKILEKYGDVPETRYSVYNNLAVVCTEINRLDEAEEYLKKSLAIGIKLNDSSYISRSITNTGTVYLKRKDYKKALGFFQKGLTIDRRLSKKLSGILENEILIGEVYFGLRDLNRACSALEKSYKVASEKGYLDLQSRAAVLLKEIYLAKGDYKKAFEFQDAYYLIKDSLYNLQKQEEIFKQSVKFEFERKIHEDSIKFNLEQSRLKSELILAEEKEKKTVLIYLAVIALVAIILLAVFFSFKQKRRSQQIELEKKLSEARMNALLLQMNPHFVFNSINSVMVLIQNYQKDEALKYLTKFSRVLRLILEGSTKQSVSLRDEVNLIQLYVELEQLRFPDSFDFEMKIGNDVDTQNTDIPFMVIQPFVENAVLHGLQNKCNLLNEEGKLFKGKLKVSFRQSGEKIICEVEDNGIGRKKANEIKESSLIKNQSLGIKVSKERLNLLSNMSCEIEYADLFDDSGNPSGTRAIIQLPILNHF